jgi:leader peptidase (prepilin peptidase)/N-methyltransferase
MSISVRYPIVELITAVLFVLMGLRFGAVAALPAYLYFAALGVVLSLIDLDVKRLPDALTLPSYPVGFVLLGAASTGDLQSLLRAVLGALAMFAVYFAMCFAYPAGMGFGDVKLSGVLGLYTAWLGWDVWGAGLMLGFLLGGIFGIAVVVSRRGGRKTAVPFGPFMVLGAFVAVFAGHQLVDRYLSLTTGA